MNEWNLYSGQCLLALNVSKLFFIALSKWVFWIEDLLMMQDWILWSKFYLFFLMCREELSNSWVNLSVCFSIGGHCWAAVMLCNLWNIHKAVTKKAKSTMLHSDFLTSTLVWASLLDYNFSSSTSSPDPLRLSYFLIHFPFSFSLLPFSPFPPWYLPQQHTNKRPFVCCSD